MVNLWCRVLHVHRASRADGLADALAALLTAPLSDPFASEVVSVPTRGMERWLSQRLSGVLGASAGRGDGICANVRFPFPDRLITDAVAAASGVDPDSDPWRPERAVWPLLEVVQECVGEPWLSGLGAYLGEGREPPDLVRRGRRLSAVRHLAGLFHRYALHRPEMIGAWAAGLDTDAFGTELPAGARWQAELWRRLRARIGLPGPAERREQACQRLRADPIGEALPARVSLFGLTRLPAGHLQILHALSVRLDVHLFLLHPSPALWKAVGAAGTGAAGPPVGTAGARPARRAADPTAELAANRLLASWGRDAREMQLVLAGSGVDRDHPHGLPSHPATLLGRIQAAVGADCAPPGAPLPEQPDERPPLEPDDRSVEIHACHGRARQVEVIRDAILHALADDPSLEPRDVIVMCPDIETFAPLIQATFGAGVPSGDGNGAGVPSAAGNGAEPVAAHRRPIDLRVRLADRSLRQTNPVLAVVSRLLELAGQRVTASEVLDLADRGPVRRRFHFNDDDLTKLQGWIAQAGIRWGLDSAHRAPFKLEQEGSGTWRAGLDRLLLGTAMTEDGQRQWHGVLPLDDVDSRSIDLTGRVAELIERLGTALDALSAPQALAAWGRAIGEAADALTDAGPSEGWQRVELQRVLDELIDEAAGRGDGGGACALHPAELRAHLAERLQGRPTRANFRTGHLTVCTLMPMRSVPHRVVCLLGLDDGAFPRKAPRDGDDLMLADPQVGERDPRSEDRQLLLDALLAATERLIVTYSGNDERTNTPLPPAVPVGELLDVIDATVNAPDGPASDRVVVRHPLQPFDPRNFAGGALVLGRTWSFDPVALAGAVALSGPRADPPPFLAAPLPPREGSVVELDELVRFAEHPVRSFLRQRLGISLRGGADEVQDAMRVELDGLERWGVGQRLLEARLSGVDGNVAIKAEIARGMLPPGALGKPVIDAVYPIVEAIAAEAGKLVPQGAPADPLEVGVELGGGRRLSGTVGGIRGAVLLAATYSRVAAKHRLAAWVRLLALTASHPELELRAATVGRAGRDGVRVALAGPLGSDADERRATALTHLAVLVDLFDRGMCEPLPLFCATSAAYAEAVRSGQDAVAAAESAWSTRWRFEGEDTEPEHQLVLGGVRTFPEVAAVAPGAGEAGAGWAELETSRAGRLADRMWAGLLSFEERSAR